MSRTVIVVTGFGPFKDHEQVNSSWEAVKLLPDTLHHEGKVYEIKKLEIPVVYDQVQQHLQNIWDLDPLV